MNHQEEDNVIKVTVAYIKQWIVIFKKKWWLLLSLFLVGASYGFYKAYKTGPIYKAELTYSLDEKGSAGGASGLASQLGIDFGGGASTSAFSGDNNMELIKSRRVIEKSLLTPVDINGKQDLLINHYLRFTGFYDGISDKPDLISTFTFKENIPREQYTRAQDSLLGMVSFSLKNGTIDVTKPDKKISIYNVKVISGDEVFSKCFADVLVRNVSVFYIETKVKKYRNNVNILQNRLDSVRRELNIDMVNAAVLKDQNMNPIRAQSTIKSNKEQLNVQIQTNMYGELVKNLEIAKYSLLKEEPIIQVIDSPIYPLEKILPSKLKSTLFNGILGLFLGVFIVFAMYVKENYL